ncbi:MAG: hypothetical protein ACM34A_18010 [Bacillota bacterium]
MTSSASRAAMAFAAASALLLAGCGGGGGGTSNAPAPDRNAQVNQANASNVGAQAYWALDLLNNQINLSVLNVAAAADADYSAQLCTLGGSSKRTVDTGTNTVTLTDAKCDNGAWVSNGTQTIKLSDLTGDPFHDTAWEGTLTITFDYRTSLDPTFNTWTSSQTGDLTVHYKQTAPNVGTFQATNTQLQTSFEVAAGGASVVRNISHLAYSGEINSSGLNTFNADFTLQGKFGALGTTSYDIKKTSTAFQRQISSEHVAGKPTQGVMIIKAPDNASLTFTAMDTTSAQLAVDWNNDSVIDSSTSVTWDNLSSLANPIKMLTN